MNFLKLLWNLYQSKQNLKMNADGMKAFQDKKLRKLLVYAYENSAYYRKTFAQAGITAENIHTLPLSSFPTIDKRLLLSNFDKIVTSADIRQEELRRFDAEESVGCNRYKGKYHVVHSSGSTGKPGYFVYDEAAWNSMLTGILRAALWDMSMSQILRLLARGPRIVYIAATDGRYGGAMAASDGIAGVHASQIHLDIKTPLKEWVSQIQAFAPNMVIGYPSAIKILGGLAEQGKVDMHVLRIISCGEPLGAGLRRYLENTFHAQVINLYGASESLALGVESDPTEGILLFDDMNVIEVQNGSMYLTSLYNFAQPLIRYRLSDTLTLQDAEPYSRYPFTRADGLLGRNEDILWFEDGRGNREFLHPLAVEGICVEGLRDYQFRQTGTDAFEMYAEITASASKQRTEKIRNEILTQMKRILTEKKLDYVQFCVNFTDKILPDPQTGKKRLIITVQPADKNAAPRAKKQRLSIKNATEDFK